MVQALGSPEFLLPSEPLGRREMEVAGDVASVAATTTTAAAASQHSTIALETSLLSVLRAGLWFVARYYCNVSLFADLRSVSEETDAINGSSTVLESPTRANIALDSVGTAPNRSTNLTKSASPELLTPPTSRPSSRASASGGHLARRTSIELYRVTQTTQNDLATAIFGLAFSESCMLFILLLFGDAVSDRYVYYITQPEITSVSQQLNSLPFPSLVHAQSSGAELVNQSTGSTIAHRARHPVGSLTSLGSPQEISLVAHIHDHTGPFRRIPLLVRPSRIFGGVKSRRRRLTFHGSVYSVWACVCVYGTADKHSMPQESSMPCCPESVFPASS